MDGRRSLRGGFIRTYGRRQPYRRLQKTQPWLGSPRYQQHLFSASSSLSSSSEASLDPDFQAKARSKAAAPLPSCRKVDDPHWLLGRRKELRPRQRHLFSSSSEASLDPDFQPGNKKKKKQPRKRNPASRRAPRQEDKENEGPGDVAFAAPAELGKFITDRRRPPPRRDLETRSPRQVRLVPMKRKTPLGAACAICYSPRQPDALLQNLPLLSSTPVGGSGKSIIRELEESILRSVCMEPLCESWKVNPATPASSQNKAEHLPPPSCSFPKSKAAIPFTNGSAELFSHTLDLNESEGVVSLFPHPPDFVQKVLHIDDQEINLQPVLRLHRCVLSPCPGQPSGQVMTRLSPAKSENKNAEVNPQAVISLTNSTVSQRLCGSAELFSRTLDLSESDIKGISPFRHPGDFMQKDSKVLYIDGQKIYLQPVVQLHRCVLSPGGGQPSGQVMTRLSPAKSENKNAKVTNSTVSQRLCGSAELFSHTLDLSESDIKGISPFRHPADFMQKDSKVLYIDGQKIYLQPVVRLHSVLSPGGGQPSGQVITRLLRSKDEKKNAKVNPEVSRTLSGTNHLCTNASGSLSSTKKELPRNQADCLHSANNQNSNSTVCRKLDMCNTERSSHRANMPQKRRVNSRTPPLLTDGHKGSQTVIKGSQSTLTSDFIGTGRKVCISGFSSKRWGKRTRAHPKNAAKAVRAKEQNCSFQDHGLRLGKRNEKRIILDNSTENNDTRGSRCESVCLLNSSSLNSSSFQNLSQDSACLQFWTQIRGALSLHKKKKVKIQAPGQDLDDTSVERSYLGASAPLHLSTIKTPFGKQLNKCHPVPGHSMSLLTPENDLSLCESFLTDAEKVFEECQQDKAISFSECIPPDKMRSCEKIGEGVFGEVFKTINNGSFVALKIVPIEGRHMVNGEAQKSFGEILPEIIISRELSLLCEGCENSTDGFIKLHSVHCVKGSYPPHLLQAWDTYDKTRGSENDRPALFESDQLFIILEFDFGGNDLESLRVKLSSVASAKSILQQVIVALAVAEETLHFEHRDLHWGNILVKRTDVKTLKYHLHGLSFDIPTHGVQASIIDYTLSRLEKDGLIVFCDIAADEALFQGQGDYQFDVYRSMRQENSNSWSEYSPHSNVLWLHYLAGKLINEIRYQKKPTTSAMKGIRKKLLQFRAEVLGFVSASEVLEKSSLFR
ncbi:serine/threonine-protein kinase haspin isoform X1 [Microcaecilia unicolor]|uniref:Serine/threonine-protein kinase haspin n=1 Tax=Microcaecilia unicolor TaxID=1415580 RepID=A0A6P7X561_9AMPH|nr:serine/threonine-protein kinase haspin isoform X1 [Microcaecilia unicolor]